MAPTLSAAQKQILSLSGPEYLHQDEHAREPAAATATATATAPRATTRQVRVAAAIFRVGVETPQPSLLLLKRRGVNVADATSLELPGGLVGGAAADYCVSEALARLVRRRTGLQVVRVVGMLTELRWRMARPVRRVDDHDDDDDDDDDDANDGDDDDDGADDGDGTTPAGRSGTAIHHTDVVQLNWTVLVRDTDAVVLDPHGRHDGHAWASWSAAQYLNLTDRTRALVKESLEWAGANLC